MTELDETFMLINNRPVKTAGRVNCCSGRTPVLTSSRRILRTVTPVKISVDNIRCQLSGTCQAPDLFHLTKDERLRYISAVNDQCIDQDEAAARVPRLWPRLGSQPGRTKDSANVCVSYSGASNTIGVVDLDRPGTMLKLIRKLEQTIRPQLTPQLHDADAALRPTQSIVDLAGEPRLVLADRGSE